MNKIKCDDLAINERYENLEYIQNASKLVKIRASNMGRTEFQGILDYVKANKNIAAFDIENVDLSTLDLFKELKDSEVIHLELNNNGINTLKGADQLFFTVLSVKSLLLNIALYFVFIISSKLGNGSIS